MICLKATTKTNALTTTTTKPKITTSSTTTITATTTKMYFLQLKNALACSKEKSEFETRSFYYWTKKKWYLSERSSFLKRKIWILGWPFKEKKIEFMVLVKVGTCIEVVDPCCLSDTFQSERKMTRTDYAGTLDKC